MDKDRTTRFRIRDTVSATFLFEPMEGGIYMLTLSVVPALTGPPRILFAWIDSASRDSGRALLLPFGATRSPSASLLSQRFSIDIEEALSFARFLDEELPRLVSPSGHAADSSRDGDFDPVTETDEVPRK